MGDVGTMCDYDRTLKNCCKKGSFEHFILSILLAKIGTFFGPAKAQWVARDVEAWLKSNAFYDGI